MKSIYTWIAAEKLNIILLTFITGIIYVTFLAVSYNSLESSTLVVAHKYSNATSPFEVSGRIGINERDIKVQTVSRELIEVEVILPIGLDLDEERKESLDSFFANRGLQYQGFEVRRE